MKIDKSEYYPPSPLDDIEEEEKVSNIKDVTDVTDVADVTDATDVSNNSNTSAPSGYPLLDGFAHLLSWVLVPLMMPVYGIMMAFGCSLLTFMPTGTKIVFTLITLGITVAVPSLLVILLKRMGLVDDLGLNGRKERLIPYIISIISLGATGAFMWIKGAPMWLVMFYAGGMAAGLVNMLINFRWKISAHAAGIAGVVALMIRLIRDGYPQENALLWLLIWILLAGVLGSSRVWLGRHTVWQVLAGYAVGFTSVILMTLIS